MFKNENIGVTEFLAKKNKIYKSEVMLIYNKRLSVVPITTHVKNKKISALIKRTYYSKKLKHLKTIILNISKKSSNF